MLAVRVGFLEVAVVALAACAMLLLILIGLMVYLAPAAPPAGELELPLVNDANQVVAELRLDGAHSGSLFPVEGGVLKLLHHLTSSEPA